MKLKCTKGPLQGQDFELIDGLRFGRELPNRGVTERADPFLLLPSPSVSRIHGEFFLAGQTWGLRDLGSSNGIRINRIRAREAYVKPYDIVQIGEFTFRVVDTSIEPSQPSATKAEKNRSESGAGSGAGSRGRASSTGPSSASPSNLASDSLPVPRSSLQSHGLAARLKQIIGGLWETFENLDFRLRTLLVFVAASLFIHGLIVFPLLSEARRALYSQAFQSASRAARNLGDRNKRELAEGSHFLLDCDFLKQSAGVKAAKLFDAKGRLVCPVGADAPRDALLETALFQGEGVDDCDYRIVAMDEETCDFVVPVREWRDDPGQYLTVGVARLTFEPTEARESLQSLRALTVKSLIFSVGLLLGVWFLFLAWIRRSIAQVAEGVHLAVSGTVQSVANPESFAAFEPLLQEVNRLISKGNQGLSVVAASGASTAGFLQSLFQQVLLLEDRPIMVVDKDNHFVAGSAILAEVIPLDLGRSNAHVTDVVGDSHLQGELMGLLNDLSQSNEVIERALSMSDRIVQVRGMPLFLNEDYVASLLIF